MRRIRMGIDIFDPKVNEKMTALEYNPFYKL